MDVFEYQCGCKDMLVLAETIVDKSSTITEIKDEMAKFRARLYGTS